jgi:hypothetical protein
MIIDIFLLAIIAIMAIKAFLVYTAIVADNPLYHLGLEG